LKRIIKNGLEPVVRVVAKTMNVSDGMTEKRKLRGERKEGRKMKKISKSEQRRKNKKLEAKNRERMKRKWRIGSKRNREKMKKRRKILEKMT
jgi:hypothetical protein